jgi:hypothetical protein
LRRTLVLFLILDVMDVLEPCREKSTSVFIRLDESCSLWKLYNTERKHAHKLLHTQRKRQGKAKTRLELKQTKRNTRQGKKKETEWQKLKKCKLRQGTVFYRCLPLPLLPTPYPTPSYLLFHASSRCLPCLEYEYPS